MAFALACVLVGILTIATMFVAVVNRYEPDGSVRPENSSEYAFLSAFALPTLFLVFAGVEDIRIWAGCGLLIFVTYVVAKKVLLPMVAGRKSIDDSELRQYHGAKE